MRRWPSTSSVQRRTAVNLITSHPVCRTLNNPVSSIVALYILTGCDYVSSFYRCTKHNFLDTLLTNAAFIFKTTRRTSLITITRKPVDTVCNWLIYFPDNVESKRILTTLGYAPTHIISTLQNCCKVPCFDSRNGARWLYEELVK